MFIVCLTILLSLAELFFVYIVKIIRIIEVSSANILLELLITEEEGCVATDCALEGSFKPF